MPVTTIAVGDAAERYTVDLAVEPVGKMTPRPSSGRRGPLATIEPLYEPRSVQLDWGVFCFQLLFNLLQPFSLLVVPSAGKSNSFAWDTLFGYLVWVWPVLIYMFVTVVIALPLDVTIVSFNEVTICLLLILLHRLTVAFKYGYMHPQHYQVFTRHFAPKVFRHEEQLILAWSRPSVASQRRELMRTSVRLALNAHSSRLTLMLPEDAAMQQILIARLKKAAVASSARWFRPWKQAVAMGWQDAVDVDDEREEDAIVVDKAAGTVSVSVATFTFLLMRACRPVSFILFCAPFVLPVAHGMAPLFGRWLQGVPLFGADGATQLGAGLLFYNNLYAAIPLTFFVMSAVLDYKRRFDLLRMLGDAVSRRSLRMDCNCASSLKAAGLPLSLQLDSMQNVDAWLKTRRLLSEHGLRYIYRLQANSGIMMVIALLTVVWLLLTLLTGDGQFSSYSLLCMAVVDSVSLIFMLMLMLLWGSRANGQASEHSELLMEELLRQHRHRVALQARLDAAEEEDEAGEDALEQRKQLRRAIRTAEETEKALMNAREQVKIADERRPVRILGVRATPALLRGVILGAVTIVSQVTRSVRS
eukprot:PLAT6543.1.p1 GENE.PLAT6543.1~~PLAT6543.1.p1  ORF type:complete len:595 (+),score=213.31 PLAT6543.1:30-1787(+)